MHVQLRQAAPARNQDWALLRVIPAGTGCLPCSRVHAEVIASNLRAGCSPSKRSLRISCFAARLFCLLPGMLQMSVLFIVVYLHACT